MSDKIDFKKTCESYRATQGAFQFVDVPASQFLAVDGHGDPNTSSAFSEAVSALYPVAYTLKFFSKNHLGRDYVVPPLEGLWWAEDMEWFTGARDKSRWQWTMMLMVPEWLDPAAVERSVSQVGAKQQQAPAKLDDVRLETLHEGRCVQTLHIGPFDDEGPVLERMHREFIVGRGLKMRGKHHEIYLSDFRRTSSERLRTILRQPVVADGVSSEHTRS